MTLVSITLTVPDGGVGSPEAPAVGSLIWTPIARRVEDDRIVLGAPFTVALPAAGPTVIEVAEDYYMVREEAPAGITRWVHVPASDVTLQYSKLADVSRYSLAVTATPEAAWRVELAALAALVAELGDVEAAVAAYLVANPPTVTVADATTLAKGVVQLAGDLGGTAAAPTVPGLAGKAASVHAHAPADVTGTAVVTNDPRLTDARTPLAHTQSSSTITDFTEAVQDAVAAMLTSGTNVTLTYDDAANNLTVTAAGGDAEVMRDTIGAALVGINGVTVTVNDAADTITLAVTGLTIAQVTGLQGALDGKAATGHTHTAADVGAVPTSRTVAGKALTGDVTLTASDVGAVPTSRTVNGKALSGNISIGGPDLTAPGEGTVNTVASSGAAQTLSAAYALHDVTMSQNCTFTFTSPSAGAVFALRLAGAFTPTWPASVKWSDGAAPSYTSPAVYVFMTVNAGTIWNGMQAGKAFA